MRVGILTFVRSMNYGSFLQCYSLYSRLVKVISAEIIVINYSILTAELAFIALSLLRGLFRGTRQYKIFKDIAKDSLNLTGLMLSNSLSRSLNLINKLNADIIIAGSDEIWKIDKIRKYPNVYWNSSGFNAKKISYAASTNRTIFSNLPEKTLKDIKKELMLYDYLGVRDDNTIKQLESLNLNKKIHENCDPTFLYNFVETPALNDKLLNKYKVDLEKPIIGLVSDNKMVGKLVKHEFGNTHQIVSITCNNKYADVWLYDLTPFEWANVFSYFSGCITAYFHGTIFSILNRIPFVSFDYEGYSLTNITKIRDILHKANLIEDSYCNILKEMPNTIPIKLKENILRKKEIIIKYDHLVNKEREKFAWFERELNLMVGNVI